MTPYGPPERRFPLTPLVVGLVAGALWFASGAINGAFSWNGVLSGSIGAVFPPTIFTNVWAWPPVWGALFALTGVVSVAAGAAALSLLSVGSQTRRAAIITVWFAIVAAGTAVGFAADAATILSSWPPSRLQTALNGLGDHAAIGAYWGLVQGWIPAVIAARAHESAASRTGRSTPWLPVTATALGLVALIAVGVGGQRAAYTAAVQAEAVAEGHTEESGALPDPYAEGSPLATVAPADPNRQEDWCTPEQAMLLLGSADAATGHRVLSIDLMNFSETPCVVQGYIDIAFADQNGNELSVEIEHSGSFLTTDAGPARIEIPAGGSAIARLGWSSNPTADALVASTLFAAPYPGATRGSWPVSLDITEGSTVAVTAWEIKISSAQNDSS